MSDDPACSTDTGTAASSDHPLVDCYRHDAHKLNFQSHDAAAATFAGVAVNRPVPHGADADAAALSRPGGAPEQTVPAHENHYRLSLVSGESRYDPDAVTRAAVEDGVRGLLTGDDPETLHRTWLDSDVVAAFNESVYYPYTSLKYHTLLVAALCDCYRAGREFQDLALVVDPPGQIVPHRTVYAGDEFALRITLTADRDGRPFARLGARPRRSWASTWSRLSAHPLDIDGADNAWARVLDANLRRIQSWSTALQYIEDVREWGGQP